MKLTIKTSKEVEVKYLLAKCGVRYWEDATVNEEEDEQGDLIPCRDGDYWCPLINIETGVIENWEKGKIADIHYKICDDGVYTLLDENKNEIKSIEGYVPNTMCPKENGYGDYVIMDIDENGKISDWDFDSRYFEEEE
jgi:hypothetical protein